MVNRLPFNDMGIIQKLGKILRLAEPAEDASKVKDVLHIEEIGSSGTENFSGYYYEEYLSTLRGTQAADLWDQMRRSDPKIKMVLSAVKNPIKSAQWTIQPAQSDDKHKQHADLIEQILFKDISWMQHLAENLTQLEFGFAPFEVIHKVVVNHPKYGSYNSLEKLAWRSPRTIERWNLDKTNGKLVSISQYAYGDLARLVDIPGQYLIVFTNEKEGDNYEGISALRPCYGPWVRKNTYLKLMAIGIEKFAIPTPYMEVPEGKETSTQFTNAKKVLEKYVSHQQQYITVPAGWKLAFAQSNFDASKIREAIDKENGEIATSFLENFLELGQGGSGSYALSNDLSDFFLTGIEHIAFNICDTFNKVLIPELVKLNFGPQDEYPQLTCSGIKDKPGKELAEIMKLLVEARILTPDSDLEKNFREKYDLPKQAEKNTSSITNAPSAQVTTVPVAKLSLAEAPKTPKALITLHTESVRALMQEMLGDTGTQVIKDLMAKKKASTPSQYLTITSQVKPKGTRDYKEQLTQAVSQVSLEALKQVSKEVPKAKNVKLMEGIIRGWFGWNPHEEIIRLAENFYADLPLGIQKLVDAQVGLLTTFQMQDLLKALYFQFNNSVTSTDSDAQLEADLTESLNKFLDGGSILAGAGNTVAKTVNESRATFFFEPEVLNEIESFTFTNGDPVSPICQDLAGTVFGKDDPNMERYSPPLHHNCKSYLVPNLTGSNKQLDPTGLQPSKASLDKFITLADLSAGAFALASIEISKEYAQTSADAKRLAMEVTLIEPNVMIQESDLSYKFELINPGLLEEGSLKSFEPLEGVNVYYGRIKRVP